MAFGICNQTKLVRSKFFFLSNRPKNGSSFLYKIGLKSGFFYKLVLNI